MATALAIAEAVVLLALIWRVRVLAQTADARAQTADARARAVARSVAEFIADADRRVGALEHHPHAPTSAREVARNEIVAQRKSGELVGQRELLAILDELAATRGSVLWPQR